MAWRVKLSGGQVPWVIPKDLTGDGVPELITPEAHGIGVWTLEGEQVWFNPIRYRFIDALDVDGDGNVEVVMNENGGGSILILEGSTGATLFNLDLPAGSRSYHYNIHMGRFLPGVPGLQLAIITNNPGAGTVKGTKIESFLYSFDNGVEEPRLVWRETIQESTDSDVRFIHWATSVTGDLDSDGGMEIVTFIENGLVVQDIISGTIERFLPAMINSGRNYGTVLIDDLDQDGMNELLVLADLLSVHLEALQFTPTEERLVWKKNYSTFIHIPGASPVNDVTGDDIAEVIVSEWTDSEQWMMHIFDASTGDLLGSLPDRYVLWSGDLTGDGIAEIITTKEETLLPREFTSVEVWSFFAGRLNPLWAMHNIRLEARVGFPLEEGIKYPLNIRGRSQDARQPFLVDWDNNGFSDLFFQEDIDGDGIGERWLVVGYDHGEFYSRQIMLAEVDAPSRLLAAFESPIGSGNPILVTTSPNGIIQASDVNYLMGSFQTNQRFDFKYLIVDVDGDCKNELVVQDARGVSAINLHSPETWTSHGEGTSYTTRWTVSGNLLATADVDGDQGVEALVAIAAPNNGAAVVALKGNGSTLWKTILPPLVQSPLLWPTIRSAAVGRFTGRDGEDVYVVGRLAVPTGSGDLDRSWLLRGDTGQIVWYNDASDKRFPLPSVGPGKDAGAVPIDVNGDGADDIAMVSQVWYLVLDGKTGQLIHTPIKVTYALQNGTGLSYKWTAYSALAILNVGHDENPKLLVHNSKGHWGVLSLDPLGEYPVRGVWEKIPMLADGQRYASIANLGEFDREKIVVADGTVKVYDAETGDARYEFLGTSEVAYVSTVGVKTTSGFGIVATGGENLHLLRIEDKPITLWTFRTEKSLLSPIIGDVEGDGWSEIVVSTIGGDLLVIDGN